MPVTQQPPPHLTVPTGTPGLLRDLVHERTGIYFEDERFETVLEKLREPALARGCRSYLDYYYILKYEDPAEWLRVVDAFSVQETYFWRELEHVNALVQQVVPAWFARQRRPLHIWSAACATGEEPYSIAIALREAGWGDHPISIHASDGSEAALAKAEEGIYRERSFRSLPPGLRAKYFDAPTAAGSRIRREFLLPISFHCANLVVPAEIVELATAPVVFCRNVFIYFSAGAIRRTTSSFAARMPDGGHLFIGTSESLLRLTDEFEMRQLGDAFVYVKLPRPAR